MFNDDNQDSWHWH